ncbi:MULTISPECIES: phage terminase small subunit P27 family [unclassified Mammaliicoccus]|uniref:phage terminase small subunit P27 family n=1 Tax=unclassified Mammaliicoccus TaxID=2803851 RepID=UPI001EFB3373|nr:MULTISPECIES: phage terminase small subunit P27 family [unclassified Mammaliicoccus]
MAGRRRVATDVTKKNLTKDEIRQRKQEEELLNVFEGVPERPPTWLSKLAKKEYKRIVPLMKNLPIANLDLQIICHYCEQVSSYLELTKDIQENGYNIFIKNDEGEIINVKINPSVSKRLEVAREMRAAASMIGISLDSRIKIVAPKKNEVVEDPMDDFFN